MLVADLKHVLAEEFPGGSWWSGLSLRLKTFWSQDMAQVSVKLSETVVLSWETHEYSEHPAQGAEPALVLPGPETGKALRPGFCREGPARTPPPCLTKRGRFCVRITRRDDTALAGSAGRPGPTLRTASGRVPPPVRVTGLEGGRAALRTLSRVVCGWVLGIGGTCVTSQEPVEG